MTAVPLMTMRVTVAYAVDDWHAAGGAAGCGGTEAVLLMLLMILFWYRRYLE